MTERAAEQQSPKPPRKMTDKELARITHTIFDMPPSAGLFDNVPSDMTWGELVQLVHDLLPRVPVSGEPSEPHGVTRVEVIDHRHGAPRVGRAFVALDTSVSLSYQDDGRTLKIFVGDHRPAPDADPGRSPT